MDKVVVVDAFPHSADRYRDDHALVVVDVIRATTTAITAVAAGRRCHPVPSIEAALPVAARLHRPLLVGELGGHMPYGFDLTNSPAAVLERTDPWRPMILLSSSGTQLMDRSVAARHVYVACLRNLSATVRHLAARHTKVAVLGAGTRGEFREEDEACCAWIAEGLLGHGFRPGTASTAEAVGRWSGRAWDAWRSGASVAYLCRTGQLRDLGFILSHIDDLDAVFALRDGEVVALDALGQEGPRDGRPPALAEEVGA